MAQQHLDEKSLARRPWHDLDVSAAEGDVDRVVCTDDAFNVCVAFLALPVAESLISSAVLPSEHHVPSLDQGALGSFSVVLKDLGHFVPPRKVHAGDTAQPAVAVYSASSS